MAKKNRKKQAENAGPKADIFREGDIVVAKVKGYPFWPSRIEKINHSKRNYSVRFYGTDETSTVTIKQLKYFNQLTEKEKRCNRKGFENALRIGQEEYNSFKSKHQADSEEEEEEEEETVDQNINDEIVDDDNDDSVSISPPVPEPLSPPTTVKQGHNDAKEEKEQIEKNDEACKLEEDLSLPTDTAVDDNPAQPLDLKPSNDDKNQRTSTRLDETKKDDPSTQDNNITKVEKVVQNTKTSSSTIQSKHKILIKLKEKLAMKEQEKEQLKMKKMEQKLFKKKICLKLDVIIDTLRQVTKIVSELSKATCTDNQVDLSRIIVRFKLGFDKLEQFMDVYIVETKMEACRNKCRECHETLVSLKQQLSETQKNNRLSKHIKTDLRSIDQKIDKSGMMTILASDDPVNAMTERKENDAEKQ